MNFTRHWQRGLIDEVSWLEAAVTKQGHAGTLCRHDPAQEDLSCLSVPQTLGSFDGLRADHEADDFVYGGLFG